MKASRAMTLIELLVSLSLLAIISVVSASWMSMMLRTQSTVSADASWEGSGFAALGLIERDLLVVDRLDVGGRGDTPRVEIFDGKLRIRTRENRYVGVIEYSLDSTKKQIFRNTGTASRSADPPLLGDVEEFSFEIEEQSEILPLPLLRVRLMSDNGSTMERTYMLVTEDLQ